MGYTRRSWELLRDGGPRELARGILWFYKDRKKRFSQRYTVLSHQIRNRVRWHRSAPSPNRILYVDPTSIKYALAPRFQADLVRAGTYIKGGSWDQRVADHPLMYAGSYEDVFDRRMVVPYDDYVLYQSFVERFEHDVPWEETKIYQWMLENLDKDISRCETAEAVQAVCVPR